MTSIQIKVSKEKQNELFGKSCERIGKFLSNNQHYCNNNKVIVCDDDKYLVMICAIDADIKVKGCKTKITDGQGQKHLFIYDKKDGVFHNKKRNKILAPNYITIPHMVGIGKISEEESNELWKLYFEKYGYINKSTNVFDKEVEQRREETHTGNHHRNHFVSVPPSVYGN